MKTVLYCTSMCDLVVPISIAHTNESSDEMQFYYLGKTPEKKSETKLALWQIELLYIQNVLRIL